MEIKDILELSQLDLGELEEIRHAFVVRECPSKEVVFREEDPSDALYFVKSGRFLASKRN